MTGPRGFVQGEHICAIVETTEEQIALAADYLADGLRAGERVLYVGASESALEEFREALGQLGIDADEMVARGALHQATNAEAHLAGGRFDSEEMMQMLNDAIEAALHDGFAGLRTCGDMSWLLQEPDGFEQVATYEAMLNEFFERTRASGMCLYDSRRLPVHLVDTGLTTHSSVSIGGRHKSNPFYLRAPGPSTRGSAPLHVDLKLAHLRHRST